MKTRWVVLVVVMVALGVAGVIGPSLWERVFTVTTWSLSNEAPDGLGIQRQRVSRWNHSATTEAWACDSGKCTLNETSSPLKEARSPNGVIMHYSSSFRPDTPPRASKLAPWIPHGITAAEFWEQVKEPGEPTLEEFMAGQQSDPR